MIRAKHGERKHFVGASEGFCGATIEMAPKERNIAMMGYRSVGECEQTARTVGREIESSPHRNSIFDVFVSFVASSQQTKSYGIALDGILFSYRARA